MAKRNGLTITGLKRKLGLYKRPPGSVDHQLKIKGKRENILIAKAKKHGLTTEMVRQRIAKGWPEEIILAPISDGTEEISGDIEAWKGLTPEQLETMREFEQIGKIAKC